MKANSRAVTDLVFLKSALQKKKNLQLKVHYILKSVLRSLAICQSLKIHYVDLIPRHKGHFLFLTEVILLIKKKKFILQFQSFSIFM